jgi:hypothetical protein
VGRDAQPASICQRHDVSECRAHPQTVARVGSTEPAGVDRFTLAGSCPTVKSSEVVTSRPVALTPGRSPAAPSAVRCIALSAGELLAITFHYPY